MAKSSSKKQAKEKTEPVVENATAVGQSTSKKKSARNGRWKKILLWIGGGILAFVVTVALVLGAFLFFVSKQPESAFTPKLYAGSFKAEEAQSFDEWKSSIRSQGAARLNQNFTVTPNRSAEPMVSSLNALGLSVDWDQWMEEVDLRLKNITLRKKALIFVWGMNMTPELKLGDPQRIIDLTEKTQVITPMVAAAWQWTPQGVQITPSQVGMLAPKDLTWVIDLWEQAQLSETVEIPFRTKVPTQTEAELEPLLTLANDFAKQTLTLTSADGQKWTWPLKDRLSWFIPDKKGGWTLDAQALELALKEAVGGLEQEAASVTITQGADGKIDFEGSARLGKKLKQAAAQEAILNALKNPDGTIKVESEPVVLEFDEVLPSITVPESLKSAGIVDLVGVGYSDFSGSPANRIHNIKTGIAQFNGILIPQGAEFSFMQHLSPVDAANGFKPELVIKGDETIPEYGGGLCQISSTMFRAALFSGLPITARKNHSYAVAYYARPMGYGLDATVYDPAPDFRFVNDTPGSLLVQAYTEGSSAYYVFYGTNDARSVKLEGPFVYGQTSIAEPVVTLTDKLEPGAREVKEWGHTGFKVDWYRTVLYPENSTSSYAKTVSGVRENIHSNYEARPKKVWEGAAPDALAAETSTVIAQ